MGFNNSIKANDDLAAGTKITTTRGDIVILPESNLFSGNNGQVLTTLGSDQADYDAKNYYALYDNTALITTIKVKEGFNVTMALKGSADDSSTSMVAHVDITDNSVAGTAIVTTKVSNNTYTDETNIMLTVKLGKGVTGETFNNLSKPLQILDSNGNDITAQTTIVYNDEKGVATPDYQKAYSVTISSLNVPSFTNGQIISYLSVDKNKVKVLPSESIVTLDFSRDNGNSTFLSKSVVLQATSKIIDTWKVVSQSEDGSLNEVPGSTDLKKVGFIKDSYDLQSAGYVVNHVLPNNKNYVLIKALNQDKVTEVSDLSAILFAEKDSTYYFVVTAVADIKTTTHVNLNYTYPDGTKKTVVGDSIDWVGKALADGKVSYEPAKPETAEIVTEKIDGYTASIEKVEPIALVATAQPKDIDIDITYTENQDVKANVHFYDDTSQKDLAEDTNQVFTGKIDEVPTDGTIAIPEGYELANDQPDLKNAVSVSADKLSATYTGKLAADNSDDAIIHLVHKKSSSEQTQSYTVKSIAGPSVNQTKLPQDNIQTMEWTIEFDEVTKKYTLTPNVTEINEVNLPIIHVDNSVTYVPSQKVVQGKTLTSIMDVDKFDLADVTAEVIYHAAVVGDGVINREEITKEDVPTDNVPTAKIYPVLYKTEDGTLVGQSEFIGNTGDYVYANDIPKDYELIEGQADNYLLTEKDTSVTFIVGLPPKEAVPTENIPTAKIYSVLYKTEDGKIVGQSEFIGNAGDYVYANDIPDGYKLVKGQADKYLLTEKDTSVTFIVALPPKEDVPTDNVPTAKIYPVLYKTEDGTLVGESQFIGNAGDYVYADDVPSGYKLVKGQADNYLLTEKDTSVTFIVGLPPKEEVPTDNIPTAKIYPVFYKTEDGTLVGESQFIGNAGDYVYADKIPDGYKLIEGQADNYLLTEKDTSVTFIVALPVIEEVPTDNVPTAKVYPVLYKTADGTLVGESQFIGNTGDYVYADKVPAGYKLIEGQADNYLLTEKDTSVTFIVAAPIKTEVPTKVPDKTNTTTTISKKVNAPAKVVKTATKETLPQTGDQNSSLISAVGLAILAAFGFVFGKKRKKD